MTPLLALAMLQTIDAKTAQKEIQAIYNRLDKAYQKKDTTVFDTLMTDDFTGVDPEGKTITKAQVLGTFKQLMRIADHAKWPRKVTKLEVNKDEVVAIVTGRFVGDLPGQDGKAHHTELITTVADTWVKIDTAWKIKKSATISVQMK